MIYSMTAFARQEGQYHWGNLVCEIRSINHRYQEIAVYLPEILRTLEMPVREKIRKTIKRGKIECMFRYQPVASEKNSLLVINSSLVEELAQALKKINTILPGTVMVNSVDILRFPGVIETQEASLEVLQQAIFQLVEKTLKDLIAMREREGKGLKQLFIDRLNLILEQLIKVRERMPQLITEQQERLEKRFLDAQLELDPGRLEQEMVIFAQRIDVAEEIDRVETHIAEVNRVLKEGGAVGRRLDFLLQELNREANTLGSKSVDPHVTHAAVEMKVLIEQVREQVQNIE